MSRVIGPGAILPPDEIEPFMKAIGEGPTAFFLRGHLTLERMIRLGIERTMKRPEQFRKAKMKLTTLLYLASAMELLTGELLEALLYVDRIRNELAHTLTFELTPNVAAKLYGIVCPDDSLASEEKYVDALEAALHTCWTNVLLQMKPFGDVPLFKQRKASRKKGSEHRKQR